MEVFLAFLRLGCTSFGGPAAHLAYFHTDFVKCRQWLSDEAFAQCVALTQLLPGPASSQTGMLIGWLRSGFPGALAAWLGFTLPSAILMSVFALSISAGLWPTGWMHWLLIIATAVVASAIMTMRTSLAPDLPRTLLAIAVAAFMLLVPFAYATPIAMALAAVAGMFFLRVDASAASTHLQLGISTAAGALVLSAYALAWICLGFAAHTGALANLAFSLFSTGSLVFGGGHVVLPLLQHDLVRNGLLDSNTVLSGYAAAQAVPGPLFTIASFVGATADHASLGPLGSLVGTFAIFAPSFFLLAGIAPFYATLAADRRFRAALSGTNAGVIGLLAATLVNPILTSSIRSVGDGALALVAFVLIHFAKLPAWVLVIVAALAGFVLGRS